MGDVLLNIGVATAAAIVTGVAIYYGPEFVGSFIDRIFYKIASPFIAILRPFLRFIRVIDRK